MDLKDIKAYLETNKDNEEVKTYLGELSKVTQEGVNAFVESEDGKKWLQPKLDKNFTKGLDTWKAGNLQKFIDDAVSKANPSETPEQKQIRELTDRLNQKEAAEKRQVLLNKGILHADAKKLPKDLIEFLLGDDEQSTIANIDKLDAIFNPYITSQVEEKLKSGYKPSNNIDKNNNTLTKEDFAKMSYKDRVNIATDNPTLYKQLTE